MTTTLTRRSFVARGGAALAALSVPALAAARRAAPKPVAIYRLDPHSEHCGGGVGSCKACAGYAFCGWKQTTDPTTGTCQFLADVHSPPPGVIGDPTHCPKPE